MQPFNLSIETLAAQVIATGRAVAVEIRRSDLGKDGHDRGFIERCLRRLAVGEPFDDRDEGGFLAIQERFQREIAVETIFTLPMFHGVRDPELGDVGSVEEWRALTDRGQSLSDLSSRFETFLLLRRAVLDRLAAEKFLVENMRS